METPAGNSRQPGTGARCRSDPNPRTVVLGSLTIPGRPGLVREARAFVARTLSSHRLNADADADAATLLTSEVVTNAILHSRSGIDGGTVTIVVIRVPHGVLIEVIDDGSADTPIVKGDLYAAEGHGLYLVQHLAAQWGYLRDPASTTVWFQLPATGEQREAAEQTGPHGGHQQEPPKPRQAPGGPALHGTGVLRDALSLIGGPGLSACGC
jgi:anti-sigma regulatory factor (Ser/Thr protein kinase)